MELGEYIGLCKHPAIQQNLDKVMFGEIYAEENMDVYNVCVYIGNTRIKENSGTIWIPTVYNIIHPEIGLYNIAKSVTEHDIIVTSLTENHSMEGIMLWDREKDVHVAKFSGELPVALAKLIIYEYNREKEYIPVELEFYLEQ